MADERSENRKDGRDNGSVVERRRRGDEPGHGFAGPRAEHPGAPAAAGPGAGQPPAPAGPGQPRRPEPPDDAPRENLVHDGRFGEIFVLFLINLLLTIVTLGIYRFWGKTRIRKYVWSHTSLHGERFEYTGTGLELFLGFLFALVILGGPIGALYAWFFTGPPADPETMLTILLLVYPVAFFFFFFIYYVAIFAAYRYRISRTAWYGIRGGMEGSAWVYGFLALGLGLLNGLSLGWTKPWADSVVFRYRLSRTWFGSERFESGMNATGLYPAYSLAWIGSFIVGAIAIGIAFTLFLPDFTQRRTQVDPGDVMAIQIAMTIAYLMPILAWQLLVPWYKAALVRNIANTLSVGAVRFQTGITGGRMWKLLIPNFLLLLFTLGLAYPYVVLRTARYTADHLSVIGDIETERIRQTEVSAPWYGEGIMEFLGVGMI